MLKDFGRVFTRWQIWFLMGNQDIKMRYRRSVIGPFWISLSLGALVLGLAVLYGQIFEQPFEEYLRYLSAGFLVWFLFSAMILEGCSIGTEAEGQLRNLAIPMPVLAARMVYRNWIVFLHNTVVIIAVFATFRFFPGSALLLAVPGLLLVLCTGFFASIVLGLLCLRFRDLQQVIASATQISFFLTPIMWMPDQGRVQRIVVDSNPLYHLIEVVRAPLLGLSPSDVSWAYAEASLAVVIVLAMLVLSGSRKKVFLWL